MGTPIVTATAISGESAAIQPAATASPAPFDAVLAMLSPALPASGAPNPADAATPAIPGPALPPVGFETLGAPAPAAIPAVPVPGSMPAPPASVAMVNGADPADQEFAALVAASAVAGRGVTARLPQPPAPAPLAVSPEDFIGPIRPTGLTAEPATPAQDAAELPVAAADLMQDVPADFVGPVLPPDRRAILRADEDVVPPAIAPYVDPAEASAPAAFDVLPVPHVDPADEAETDADAALWADADNLPEAQALLQPDSEFLEQEQPETPAMASPQRASDLKPVLVGASPLTSVQAAVLAPAEGHSAQKPRNPVENEAGSAAAETARAQTVLMQRQTVAPSLSAALDAASMAPRSAQATETDETIGEETATDSMSSDQHADRDHARTEADPVGAELASLIHLAAPLQPNANAAQTQPRADQRKAYDAPRSVSSDEQPRTVPAATSNNPLPARDAAILNVLTTAAPEKPADRARARAEIRPVAPLTHDTAQTGRSDATESLDGTPLREAMPLAPRAGFVSRPNGAANEPALNQDEMPVATDTPRPLLAPHLAAMVRSVEIVNVGSTAQDAPLISAAPSILAAPPPIDTATREAPAIAAVSAEGRRDTQRDAEMRERQIKQQVLGALRAGTPELRMQLYPPGLGQVMIRLALDGQKLRLSMKADSSDATDALMLAETGLRDALSREGFSLAGFDVHDDERRGGNRREAPQQQAPVSNHDAGEGEAFSVDMTA